MTTRYFFFGTLMDPDVLAVVLGRPVAARDLQAARLDDVERRRVKDDHYPMLIAAPGRTVDGLVFETGDVSDQDRILFFEDYDYDLLSCRPVLADGSRIEARFCGAGSRIEASEEAWTLDAWAARYKAGFLELSRAYMDCFGRLTPDQAEPVWLDTRARLVREGLL